MKNTLRTSINQAPRTEIYPKYLLDPVSALTERCYSANIPVKLLTKLIHFYITRRDIRVNLESLTKLSGDEFPDCSTKSITRYINQFIEMGIIVRIRRYKRCNRYRINPFAVSADIILKLSRSVSYFKKLAAIALLGPGTFMYGKMQEKVREFRQLSWQSITLKSNYIYSRSSYIRV